MKNALECLRQRVDLSVESLRKEMKDIEIRLREEFRSEISKLSDRIPSLENRVGVFENRIARLEGAYQELSKRVDEIKIYIGRRVEDISERIEDLDRRIDALDKRIGYIVKTTIVLTSSILAAMIAQILMLYIAKILG